MRDSEPVRIGVPTSRPNSVSLSPSSSLMRMPMIEKIVHTAKQTVKARVDIQSARPGRRKLEGRSSHWWHQLLLSALGGADPRRKQKAAGQAAALLGAMT